MLNISAIVPSHQHWAELPRIVAALRAAGLPIFIVDDGSTSPAREEIGKLHDPERGIRVERLSENRGKGAAVMEGIRLAWEAGFTHALQIDADGQHDLAALPLLLTAAEQNPGAMISGQPIYDSRMPLGRRAGRWITHFWVWVETLSFSISDSMCGFRIYPLGPVRELLGQRRIGRRMDFDTEIVVRLFWRGVAFIGVPVRVTYPPGNHSNFKMVKDNLRITRMHTQLFFEMLFNLGTVLANRPKRSKVEEDGHHWAALAERGTSLGLRICILVYRIFGRSACKAILVPIVFYFYLTGTTQRRASHQFLTRALGYRPTARENFGHFMGMAERTLDAFIAWTGGVDADKMVMADPRIISSALAEPHGALIVVSHFGNAELSRALCGAEMRARMIILVHTRHAKNYSLLLRHIHPEAALRLLEVTEIDVATAMTIKERIEAGEWVVIAGDRSPVTGPNRVSHVPFLAADAPFPQGPWLLAHLLGCPVYLLFCVKDGENWRLTFEPFAERIQLPRLGRNEVLTQEISRYARRLESHVRTAPMQWYNFYDFWADQEEP